MKPDTHLTHGGLECGIISDRCGGLDTIAFGCMIENLHVPDERLFIPSLLKNWEFMTSLLAAMWVEILSLPNAQSNFEWFQPKAIHHQTTSSLGV